MPFFSKNACFRRVSFLISFCEAKTPQSPPSFLKVLSPYILANFSNGSPDLSLSQTCFENASGVELERR